MRGAKVVNMSKNKRMVLVPDKVEAIRAFGSFFREKSEVKMNERVRSR